MSQAGQRESRRVLRMLVLNALTDAVVDRLSVIDSVSSRSVVREAFDSATDLTPPEFEAQIEAGLEGDGDDAEDLRETVMAVMDELERMGASVVLDHRVEIGLTPVELALYSFSLTRNPAALDPIDFGPAAAAVTEGAAAAENGDYDDATEAFDRAIEQGDADDDVPLRTLAGLACHWGGEDDLAMDYVEEAMHLDPQSNLPLFAGLPADADDPDAFRGGQLGVRLFIRATVEDPPGTSVSLSTGRGTEWTDHNFNADSTVLTDIDVDTMLRLRLRGKFPSFPDAQGYYVGLGVVDCREDTAQSVERIVLSGPETADSIETLHFEK